MANSSIFMISSSQNIGGGSNHIFLYYEIYFNMQWGVGDLNYIDYKFLSM